MKIHLYCTANLGDFMSALPVLSGISKHTNENIDFIIRPEMKKFNGIKEFLMHQGIFSSVNYSDDLFVYGTVLNLSSWTREEKNNPNRPIETCRYENWVNDNYGINFEVDDDFEVKVADMDVESFNDKHIIGDRWSHETIDSSRNTNVVEHGAKPDPSKVVYLDYSKSLMYNCNVIKKNPNPFITTFTGIGIISDMMNKETIVCWDDNMQTWVKNTFNKPIEFDFERHYYGNRKTKLVYVKDLAL